MSRRRLCEELIRRWAHAVLYVDHMTAGAEPFRVISERDMEGIVAKRASACYAPDRTTWVANNRKYLEDIHGV